MRCYIYNNKIIFYIGTHILTYECFFSDRKLTFDGLRRYEIFIFPSACAFWRKWIQ